MCARPPGSLRERHTVNILRTAAARSSVIHAISINGSASFTECGTRIGDDWEGEYSEAPTGPVTCKRCLPHLPHCTECGVYATHTHDDACPTVAVFGVTIVAETTPTVRVKFTAGQRVGLLRGIMDAKGPQVYGYGTVIRVVEYWEGMPEYVVLTDKGEELFTSYLLTAELPLQRCEELDRGHLCGMPVRTDSLSPRCDTHARARSMAAHPAGKGRYLPATWAAADAWRDRALMVTGEAYRAGMPAVPVYQPDPFPGVAEDDGRTGIVKSGGQLFFRLF